MDNKVINRLDRFIKDYYKNKIIRGSIISLIVLVSLFLLFVSIEYFFYFSITARSFIYYGYIALALFLILYLVVHPLSKYFSLGKRITHKQASIIIGDFFPEVSDKLLNLLQLQDIAKDSESQLLMASIDQKAKELRPIPFRKAIDFAKNKKYLKYLSIPLLILILTLFVYPTLISESSYRYYKHNQYFSPPQPFSFHLLNKSLDVMEKEDFEVRVRVEGKAIPNSVEILVNDNLYIMKKEELDLFSFTIKHIQNQTSFHIRAGSVRSEEYSLNLRPKPVIIDLQAKIVYPRYTGISEENYGNISDFSVPKGSQINWYGITRDTEKLVFDFEDNKYELTPSSRGSINLSKHFIKDETYKISTYNQYSSLGDYMEFSINIIDDLSPQIAVIEQKEGRLADDVYFRGQIKDDYGFSKLSFVVEKNMDREDGIREELEIRIGKEKTQEFYYHYNFNQIEIAPEDRIEYYFEVWDNDGIDGPKSTRSQLFVMELPSMEDIEREREKVGTEIEKTGELTMKEIKKLQEEIKDLQRRLLEKKSLDWQDKKMIEELRDKHKNLKEELEKISENLKDKNALENKFNSPNQDILEKKKELEKLFQELIDKDIQEMLEELRKMAEENIDKDKLKESLDKLGMDNRDLEREIDRNLELFKRLEIEQKLEETIDKLKDMAKEEKALSEKTKDGSMPKEEIEKKQSEINKKFEEIKEELDKVNQKGSELEDRFELPRDKEIEEEIEKNLNEAMKNLEKNKSSEASDNQKSASEQMQEMAEGIEEAMDEMEDEQLGEDIDEVRQILKNIVTMSIAQEDIMDKLNEYTVTDPKYQDILSGQNKIKSDMKMISDSLFAMSKRQPQVGQTINKELSVIDDQISKSLESLLKYNQGIYNNYKNLGARTPQQYTMTSMNNLALMLAESLDNMQNQLLNSKNAKSGSKGMPKSSCDNPSRGKNKSLKEMQDALNKEMEKLRKQLESQKKDQKGRPRIGEGAELNEELARMAAQQEMIRKMVQEMANEEKARTGQNQGELDNIMRQMEQTEKDIVNKIINQQTINRQNNIMTRLLEHEKAQLQREKEERRESNVGKDMINKGIELLEFEKLKNKELELFRQVAPVFSPYYKNKVDEYFLNLDSN